jgi:hypothetical protein
MVCGGMSVERADCHGGGGGDDRLAGVLADAGGKK